MGALQFSVEGGRTLSGTIRPSGNKNAALPIIAAALLTEHPVTLENLPRIRDVEVLVELVKSTGVQMDWTGRNTPAQWPRPSGSSRRRFPALRGRMNG